MLNNKLIILRTLLNEAKISKKSGQTSTHRHSVQAQVAADSKKKFKPYSFQTTSGETINVTDSPEEHTAQFEPVTGLATPGQEEAHGKKLARIKEILGSYSARILPDASGSRKETVIYGELDGKQLLTPPTIGKPAAISTRTGGKGHNQDWDDHIKAGMQHAWKLFTTDQQAFRRLHREARDLAPGLDVWSVSPKTEATTEEDPTVHNYAIYAPPADTGRIERRTTCAHCTVGCKGSCLSQSGHASLTKAVPLSRLKRTHLQHMAPAHFAALMLAEMVGHQKKASATEGHVVAWRPNGTTDQPYHDWIPELFHKDKMVTNNQGVRVMSKQHAPMFAGSYSYAYTAVPEIIQNFSNVTHSFKETKHSITAGIDHILGGKTSSWLPIATQSERNLPEGIIFHRKKSPTDPGELILSPAINGNRSDNRPVDHITSLRDPHVRNIRASTTALETAGFKVTPGTVAVGTTKVPKNKEGADEVINHGLGTGFLRDPNSVPPQQILAKLPKQLQSLRWHYFEHIESSPQGSSQGQSSAPVQVSVSAKPKLTNESYCPYCDPLYDYV